MSQSNSVVPMHGDKAGRQPALVDIEAEAQVIGCVLHDSSTYRECCFLDEAAFSDPVHARIWSVVQDAMARGATVTAATLAVMLADDLSAVGGRKMLSALASEGPEAAPAVAAIAERLRQLALWRRLSKIAREIDEWTRERKISPDEAISALIRRGEGALNATRISARTKQEVAAAALATVLEPRDIVTTGIEPLDFLMHGGMIAERMYGICGLYGRGKTILLGTISENFNRQGVKHLFITLETPPEDVEIRNCARNLELNAAQLYDQGDPLFQRFVKHADRYIESIENHTFYEHMPGATINEIHRTIVRAIHRHGIKGVILDYWQLIGGKDKGQNKDEHLKEVANRLAAICRKEKIWILITAQADENGKLADSKGLAVAASLLIFLNRGENDDIAYLSTEKSNYSRYADTSGSSSSGLLFDLRGPHFRSVDSQDLALMTHRESNDLDLV